MMTSRTDPELIRLLHGELGPEEARALRERIGNDPGLAAAWGRLERTWSALEPPPAAPPPPGFAGRVMAHVRSQGIAGAAGVSWRSAPRWVRTAAAAALLAGAAAGIGVGVMTGGADPDASADAAASSLGSPEFNLAESYWGGVEDATARPGEAGNPGTEVRR
jgi:anti-sigma factor RsiW